MRGKIILSTIFLALLIIAETASAGVLIRFPRTSNSRGYSRSTTAPLRATNPNLDYRSTSTTDVAYYFSMRRAEDQYEKDLFRWEKNRVALLEKQQKEKDRLTSRNRRGRSGAETRISGSSSNDKDPKTQVAVARDPRAWFREKIAGSFGPRPSHQQTATVTTEKEKTTVTTTAPTTSSALLDPSASGDGGVPAKEGLWTKFLRVLGLKK